MIRELTCIICPIGCQLTAEVKGNEVIDIKGNTCPRGKNYATNECTNPTRTITTTVRCKTGELLPVKTASPIPKDKIKDAMKIINNASPSLPIYIGDVIIEDVFNSKIIAAKNLL